MAATFASVAGEPALDAAIVLEDEHGHGDTAGTDEATVSRSDQRGVGLFGAFAVTGAAFGALLALTAHGLRRGRPDAKGRLLVAGAVLAGAFAVAPWFKYPPNPPGASDPETLAERQWLYLAVIAIAAVVGLGATVLGGRLRAAGWPDHRRWAAVVAAVAVPMLAAYALLPPAPDEVSVPASLVWRFRVASLGAQLTLWSVLTLALVWVVAELSAGPGGGRGAARRP